MTQLLSQIKECGIWTKIHSEDSVINITEYLKSNTLDYQAIDSLLDYIHNEYNLENNMISKKLFTSIIMISKFPDDLIGKERGDKEESIYTKSKEIYDLINTSNIDGLNKKLVTFKIMFNEWKAEDKLYQINLLCEMYYKYTDSLDEYISDIDISDEELLNQNKSITDTMNNESKQEYIDKIRQIDKEKKEEYVTQIHSMKNRILHSLKKLTPQYQKYLKNYKLQDVQYDESVYKVFYNKMKYVYWNNIKTDIFKKRDKSIYCHILTDYIELINSLQLKELDMSNLNSFAEYDVNEDNLIDACISICTTFINMNKSIDSENYDEIYDMLLNKLSTNDHYITHIFKFCFDRLETIKKIKTTISVNTSK